jgi:hypothetical protein
VEDKEAEMEHEEDLWRKDVLSGRKRRKFQHYKDFIAHPGTAYDPGLLTALLRVGDAKTPDNLTKHDDKKSLDEQKDDISFDSGSTDSDPQISLQEFHGPEDSMGSSEDGHFVDRPDQQSTDKFSKQDTETGSSVEVLKDSNCSLDSDFGEDAEDLGGKSEAGRGAPEMSMPVIF